MAKDGKVTLTFSAIGDNATAELQYREKDKGEYANVVVGNTGIYISNAISKDTTSVEVNGLESGKIYQFKLVVTGGTHAGESNIAEVSIPQPIVPITDLKAISNVATKVGLSFTAIGNGATAKIQYKKKADQSFSDVVVGSTGVCIPSAIGVSTTQIVVSGLTGGQEYQFKLVVTGGTHAGDSNVVSIVVAQSIVAITDLKATSNEATKVGLSFTAIGNGATAKIQYREKGGATFSDVVVGGNTGVRIETAINTTDTGRIVSGLTSGKEYEFKLVVTGGTHAGDSNIVSILVK